jgi:hypothetical protein
VHRSLEGAQSAPYKALKMHGTNLDLWGEFETRPPLSSFAHFAFFAANSPQLYFLNTSRAITMRITSEAPSVIKRLR